MSQSTLRNSNPLSVVTSGPILESPNPAQGNKKLNSTLHQRKLPLGAIVSPLSPFFSERAKMCALEQAKAKLLEEALKNSIDSSANSSQRARSTSQSSKFSDSSSNASSTSNSSLDSNKSIATAISSMEDEQLPSNLPRISYEEWSKFGISLFTPKLMNPHSKMHYHYPPTDNKKFNNILKGNRPRSKSSVVPGSSPSKLSRVDHLNNHSTNFAMSNRPHPRSPLTRFNSLRVPLERNYST